MPSTIREWRNKYPDFSANYASAKVKQAHVIAEDCLEIADDSKKESWAVNRLRIDTRKWIASKLLPKTYGDKYVLEKSEEENEKLREELRVLRAELDAKNKKDY
jgi:flagellar motility protein MotE (MotC chaperone)